MALYGLRPNGICEGEMEIKEYKNDKEAEIRRLYTEVGWTAYTENMPALD